MGSPETKQPKRKRRKVADVKEELSLEINGAPNLKRRKQYAQPGRREGGNEEIGLPSGSRDLDRKEKGDQEAKTVQKRAAGGGEVGDAARFDGLGGSLSIPKMVHSLRNPKLSMDRKLELACNFIGAFERRQDEQDEWIEMPHFVSFLSDWLQSAIIKSPKETAVVQKQVGGAGDREYVPASLNAKCWTALHWCLRSGHLQGVNSVSPGILKGITFVLAEFATGEQDLGHTGECEAGSGAFGRGLSEALADVLHVLLAEYERSFRPNFDQWFSLALAALNLAQVKGLTSVVSLNGVGPLHLLVLVVIEGFARFVTWYPYPRTVFETVVEKLLPPLLLALADSSWQVSGDPQHQNHHSNIWHARYLQALQSLVRDGLFNSSHVGEFAEACVLLASPSSSGVEEHVGIKEAKHSGGQGSTYHRRLFEKLEQLRRNGNPVALSTMGLMLRAYAQKLKSHSAAAGQDVFGIQVKEKVPGSQNQTGDEHIMPVNPDEAVAEGQSKNTEDSTVGQMNLQKKAMCQSEKLFAVFAEFTGPLMKEFGELFQNRTPDNFESVDMTISRAVYLLNAVNSLLSAAKDEHVYIPTEDTPTDAHLGFLKYLQESIVKAARLLTGFPVDKKFGHAPLMKQIIVSCGHLLDIECRVTDEHVTMIWLILFMAIAVRHTEENDGINMEYVTSPEVLEVACQIILTFSDLRQVDRAILVLCSCLRNIMTGELVDVEVKITDKPIESLCLILSKAAQSVVASRPFLDTVASVMKKLPEGQTAQVLRGVAADLVETLQLFGKIGGKFHDAVGATNALSEIYAHVLENANVTATNSVLVGASFRKAGSSGISVPLANLIHIALSNFRRRVFESNGESAKEATGSQKKGCKNNAVTGVTGQPKRSTGDGSEVREKCPQLSASRTCFLLRIFLSYRSLDRQCRSLMPPKVARKANAEIGEPSLDLLSMGIKEISINLVERKLFACIGLGTEHLPDILRGIEEVHDQVSDKHPALAYLLDCLALQRVVDLKKHLRMLKFHPVKFDQAEDTAPDKGDSDALCKIAASLKQETSSLVAFMCRGVVSLRQSIEHLQANADVRQEAPGTLESLSNFQERGWDMIISTLRAETLPVARWRLLCLTVDVWSEHAADNSLEDFVACMLASHLKSDRRPGTHAQNTSTTSFHGANFHQSTCVGDLTKALLTDSRFFEQHQLRKVFSPVFWKNMKDSLPAVFYAQRFSGKGDYAELESTTEIRLDSRSVNQDFEKQATFISQRLALLKEGSISKSKALRRIQKLVVGTKVYSTFRALESCSSLLDLLSNLPRGYFTDSDIAEHSLHLAEVERYLVFALFNIRDAVLFRRKEFVGLECSTNLQNMITVLLQAFSSCRCALKSLAFPGPNGVERGCALTHKLLESEDSATWLTLSVHAAAAAVSDLGILLQGPDANAAPFMWNHLSATVVSTCQIIRYICSDVFNQEARSLLIIEKASGSVGDIHHPPLVDADLSSEQSMPRLAHALCEQLRVFEPCFTSLDLGLLSKEGNSQLVDDPVESSLISSQRDWFGVHVVLSAVSSYLWSIVSSLDGINEKCHDGDNHDLRWQAELPKSWLLSMKELETILVKSLLSLVGPGESEVVAVDNQQSAERKTGKQKKGPMWEDNAKVCYEHESLNDERMSNEELGRPDNLIEVSSSPSTHGPDLTAIAESERRIVHRILGENKLQRSECIGQLFSGVAALLRVRSLCFAPSATGFASKSFLQFGQVDRSLVSWVKVLLRVAYWLLEAAVSSSSLFEASNKRWLLGVVQFMESMGGLLSCVSPPIPASTFGKLIDLHMKLLGALAPSRQGRLGLHTVGSSGGSQCGNLYDMVQRVDGDCGYGREFLDSLRHATEMSFGMLLKDCPRQHFLVALQLAEKSVVDAPVFGYGLEFSLDNGRSGRPVAAGIQSMAMFLKAITSKNRLRLLANHSAVFLSAIFNLLGKMQNLQLDMLPCEHAWQDETSLETKATSDAAFVILLCLEILTMLASRPVLFPMGANYVSMGLHLPALLFRHFYEVRMPAHLLSQSYLSADQQTEVLSAKGRDHSKLLMNLYVGCCQHLCSLLRHRTREAGHCIALLGESVKVLLRCLGVPNWHSSWKRPGGKVWNIADVKVCASWLRRVYEELGEQKATLGNYSAHILAEYLCVVSGVGALSSGLNREVESALRPGAFALVDACTPRDLQQLYATLGDGPQRTALTSLRNDYERHFKYTGKV